MSDDFSSHSICPRADEGALEQCRSAALLDKPTSDPREDFSAAQQFAVHAKKLLSVPNFPAFTPAW
jgi:hypothetical protein